MSRMNRKRKKYSLEEKEDIFTRLKDGETVASINKETSIPATTLRDWKRDSGTGKKEAKQPEKKKFKSLSLVDLGFVKVSCQEPSASAQQAPKRQRSFRSANTIKDFTEWMDIMRRDVPQPEKGWKERPDPFLGFSRCDNVRDCPGVFELAVYKKGDETNRKVVYVKDGKIKTLLRQYCQHGFQKSKEINETLEKDYVISARWNYFSNETEAANNKRNLLERYAYEWNIQKPRREDNEHQLLRGNWSGWLKIVSSECSEGWIKRGENNVGYRLGDIEAEFGDKYGILETKVCSQTDDSGTKECEFFIQSGKILTLAKGLCSNTKSVRIEEALRKGKDIWVRYKYVDPNTDAEANKVKHSHLDEFQYQWNSQRQYRENTDNNSDAWSNWEKVMVFECDNGWHDRDKDNKGYWSANLDNKFHDQFGVFEFMVEQNNEKIVKYVDQGKILSTVRQFCKNGSRKAIQINKALEEGYSIWIRCMYASPSTREHSLSILAQLLDEYDYEWNKSLRENLEGLMGEWSDWITMIKADGGKGWERRRSKGYTRQKIDKLFDSQAGIFEMKLEKRSPRNNSDSYGQEKDGEIVYVGSGDIRLEMERCCKNSFKYISKYIDNALEKNDTISVRYSYDKNDNDINAQETESKLLERYDYPWIRKRREEADDEISNTWSEWRKVLKPGQVETGWTWRNKQCVGFMLQDLESYFPNDIGVFELALDMEERHAVVHVARGKVLESLKEYCNISRDDKFKGIQVSEALFQGLSILARYHLKVNSETEAKDIERQLLERYDYRWNRTNREEVDDSIIPGQGWSKWKKIVIHDRAGQREDGKQWTRRHREQTGFRLSDENLRQVIDDTKSGVYELAVQGDRRKQIVVYVGKSENLYTRISEYLERGSHKGDDIKLALSLEYDIHLRFRYTDKKEDAEIVENELLDRYDYSWNDSRNERTRNIL